MRILGWGWAARMRILGWGWAARMRILEWGWGYVGMSLALGVVLLWMSYRKLGSRASASATKGERSIHVLRSSTSRHVCKSQHDIFLSHSTQEKAFVEQLYHDLVNANQHPFFDQCPICLPMAMKFAPQILEAAKQCRVGVVVVSEAYFMSKWPMLELSKFVESGVPVFPLFLKLSPSDLKDIKLLSKCKQSWKSMVKKREVGEEVVELWSKAVKELRSNNGLDFGRFAKSEHKYRGVVVEEICKRWPPIFQRSTDGVQGYERLCKATSSLFMEVTVGDMDKRVHKYLGIYGMGGLGKTTLCKSMCTYFLDKFRGMVLHLELPSEHTNDSRAMEERLVRLKRVLQKLARVEKSVLEAITNEEEGWACLKARVRNMPPVFLALDNVGDFAASREEAQRYLKIGLPSESTVLVTARSREILNVVIGNGECCKPILRLKWVEAATLLLWYAAPNISSVSSLEPRERETVDKCLGKCQFKDCGYTSRQYHPLVLRALGTYLHDVRRNDVMSWGEALESWREARNCGEAASVNDILGFNYRSLSDQEKMVFLDSVLCHYQYTTGNVHGWWLVKRQNDFEKWLSWISEVHGVSSSVAKMMAKKLQRLSLVEDSDVEVSIHDLYKEFARALVEKEGSKEWQWWMIRSSEQTLLKRLVLNKDRSIIGTVAPRRFLEWRGVVVLDLMRCDAVGPDLEVWRFRSLRTLSVYHCRYVKRILCSCNEDYDDGVCCYKRNPGEGCMSELTTVTLRELDSLEAIPFMRHCWNLRHFYMNRVCSRAVESFYSESDRGADFSYLQALESYYVNGSGNNFRCDTAAYLRWLLCALELRNLVAITFGGLDVEGVGGHTLDLNEVVALSPRLSCVRVALPEQIEELKGLHLLSELTMLDLRRSRGLRHVLDLRCLPKLKYFCVWGCSSLLGVMKRPEVHEVFAMRSRLDDYLDEIFSIHSPSNKLFLAPEHPNHQLVVTLRLVKPLGTIFTKLDLALERDGMSIRHSDRNNNHEIIVRGTPPEIRYDENSVLQIVRQHDRGAQIVRE